VIVLPRLHIQNVEGTLIWRWIFRKFLYQTSWGDR